MIIKFEIQRTQEYKNNDNQVVNFNKNFIDVYT